VSPTAQDSPDLIATTRAAIEQRLNELRPLVAEVGRLERALAALEAIEERPRAQRARGGAAGGRRPRGRRSAATRADEFLALVRERPGVTVPEAARATGAAPTYLYRIAATLEREGTVRREGRGFAAPGVEGRAAPHQPGEGSAPPTGVEISGP
jgi:hypothetical protein